MNSEALLEVRDGGVLTLTLNRPDKLNAINYELADCLTARLELAEKDTETRVIVLTGAGDRAFSAGADIHEFTESVEQGPAVAEREFPRRGQRMTATIEGLSKPVIAAVNGLAYGGGCEITEASHLSIASAQATFAKPEINIGIPPTFGGTQRLPRLAGRKRALEHLLTGDPFDAEHALRLGLVNAVVPDDELMPSVRELANRIMRHSPLAVGAILNAVTRGINASIAEGLLWESDQFARMAATKDIKEGLSAWKERRAPTYTGT